jgi:hypothetical protein
VRSPAAFVLWSYTPWRKSPTSTRSLVETDGRPGLLLPHSFSSLLWAATPRAVRARPSVLLNTAARRPQGLKLLVNADDGEPLPEAEASPSSCRRRPPDYQSCTRLESITAPPPSPSATTVRVTPSSVRRRRPDVSQKRRLSPVPGRWQGVVRIGPAKEAPRGSGTEPRFFINMCIRGSECCFCSPSLSAPRLPLTGGCMQESHGRCWKRCPAYLRLRLFLLQ